MGGGDGGHPVVPAVPAEPSHQTGLQDGLRLHLPERDPSGSRRHLGCKWRAVRLQDLQSTPETSIFIGSFSDV